MGGVAVAAASAALLAASPAVAAAAIACVGIYVGSIEAGAGLQVDRSNCSCTCWDGASCRSSRLPRGKPVGF